MKEINDKTLSKIYSGYIGGKIKLSQHRFSEDQEDNILTLDGVCSDGFYVKETGIKSGFCSNDSLLVCHLRNITDEDAIEVAKYLNWGRDIIKRRLKGDLQPHQDLDTLKKEYVRIGKQSIDIFNDKVIDTVITTPLEILNCTQYLQSKGYALPYLDYSVEDLVELGVYKLK